KRHKRFDDVVDSGIAFATAVAFAEGCFHHWGTGDDGTIVGPGSMSLQPQASPGSSHQAHY
ncbi:MAG: hypothetical protein GY856_50760, partial [bacterium]|nr:hypothetical protein [bacterium]